MSVSVQRCSIFSVSLGVLHQPRQSFIAGLKSRKFTPGKDLHFLRERLELLCSHPGRFCDIGLIEDGGFFQRSKGVFVKRCPCEIGKYQDRIARPGGHKVGKCSDSLFDLRGGTVRQIQQKNLLTLMSDELNAYQVTSFSAPETVTLGRSNPLRRQSTSPEQPRKAIAAQSGSRAAWSLRCEK